MERSNDGWDWRFTDPAQQAYETLRPHAQERIVSKLNEIVDDQWCEPTDYLDPLTGAPHSKLRIGAFRLGCKAVHTDGILWVYTIKKRSDAYKPGDDLSTKRSRTPRWSSMTSSTLSRNSSSS